MSSTKIRNEVFAVIKNRIFIPDPLWPVRPYLRNQAVFLISQCKIFIKPGRALFRPLDWSLFYFSEQKSKLSAKSLDVESINQKATNPVGCWQKSKQNNLQDWCLWRAQFCTLGCSTCYSTYYNSYCTLLINVKKSAKIYTDWLL